MESMALYNLVARFEFSKFTQAIYDNICILRYPSDVFLLKAEHFLQFSNQIPYPFSSFLWSPHISRYANQIPTFLPTSTPLTRWLSNGCHQIFLTLHRGWIRKSWSWSRTRRSTPPPKLRWRLPWSLIYKLRNNSLFLVSKKKHQTTLRTCFFWIVWISWDIYNLRMVEGFGS